MILSLFIHLFASLLFLFSYPSRSPKNNFPWEHCCRRVRTSVNLCWSLSPSISSFLKLFFILFYFFWYMKIYYYHVFIIKMYDLGLSFLPLYKAKRETLATLTTLKRTPGMSPTAWPLRPNPATRTSSFSSIKFKQPSLGTKAVIFFAILD